VARRVTTYNKGDAAMKYGIFSLVLGMTLAISLTGCSSAKKADAPAAAAPAAKEAAAPTANKTAPKAKAAAVASTAAGDIVCEYSDIKRELKVIQNPDGCKTEYTKDGATQEVASGAVGSNFCGEVANRIKGNLEAAGYKCR
jgi:membrane protein involved in colicin uptake